jgi:hypothetical protein
MKSSSNNEHLRSAAIFLSELIEVLLVIGNHLLIKPVPKLTTFDSEDSLSTIQPLHFEEIGGFRHILEEISSSYYVTEAISI